MLQPYREVLRTPGAMRFSGAGVLARLPMSTYGLGFVLLVSAATGRYGLAGAVTAVYGLTTAVVSPFISRLVDRRGQAVVLFPVVTGNAVAVLLLVVAVEADAPTPVLLGCGALVGALSLSIGSLVRARWRHVLAEGGRLHTAFALESVLDEMVFIVGPIVITLVATRIDPAVGVLGVMVVSTLAGWWLASLRGTEPPAVRVAKGSSSGSALRIPAVALVAAVMLAAGGLFGGAEVTTVAFADERGRPAAAGLVLGTFAFGSMLSGLAYGAIRWRAGARKRFALAVVALAVGTLPFAFVTTLPLLGGVMFLAGLAISPMIVAAFGLVEEVLPSSRLTEGLTWCTTSLNLGVAGGTALCGPLIDAHGASRAFLVTTGCGIAAALVALLGISRVPDVATSDNPGVLPPVALEEGLTAGRLNREGQTEGGERRA